MTLPLLLALPAHADSLTDDVEVRSGGGGALLALPEGDVLLSIVGKNAAIFERRGPGLVPRWTTAVPTFLNATPPSTAEAGYPHLPDGTGLSELRVVGTDVSYLQSDGHQVRATRIGLASGTTTAKDLVPEGVTQPIAVVTAGAGDGTVVVALPTADKPGTAWFFDAALTLTGETALPWDPAAIAPAHLARTTDGLLVVARPDPAIIEVHRVTATGVSSAKQAPPNARIGQVELAIEPDGGAWVSMFEAPRLATAPPGAEIMGMDALRLFHVPLNESKPDKTSRWTRDELMGAGVSGRQMLRGLLTLPGDGLALVSQPQTDEKSGVAWGDARVIAFDPQMATPWVTDTTEIARGQPTAAVGPVTVSRVGDLLRLVYGAANSRKDGRAAGDVSLLCVDLDATGKAVHKWNLGPIAEEEARALGPDRIASPDEETVLVAVAPQRTLSALFDTRVRVLRFSGKAPPGTNVHVVRPTDGDDPDRQFLLGFNLGGGMPLQGGSNSGALLTTGPDVRFLFHTGFLEARLDITIPISTNVGGANLRVGYARLFGNTHVEPYLGLLAGGGLVAWPDGLGVLTGEAVTGLHFGQGKRGKVDLRISFAADLLTSKSGPGVGYRPGLGLTAGW